MCSLLFEGMNTTIKGCDNFVKNTLKIFFFFFLSGKGRFIVQVYRLHKIRHGVRIRDPNSEAAESLPLKPNNLDGLLKDY
jgi:hypothetical protein